MYDWSPLGELLVGEFDAFMKQSAEFCHIDIRMYLFLRGELFYMCEIEA